MENKKIRIEIKEKNDIALVNRVVGLVKLTTGKDDNDIDVFDKEGVVVLNLNGKEPEYIIEKSKDALNKTFGKCISIL